MKSLNYKIYSSLCTTPVLHRGTLDAILLTIPTSRQNFVEYVLEFIRDLTRTQIGEEEYRPWIPFIAPQLYEQ